MNSINRRSVLPFAAMVALMFLGVQTLAQSAQDQLVGTWMLVSVYIEGPDGTRFDSFGPDPTASLLWMETATFSVQFIGSGLVFRNSRPTVQRPSDSTPEENKAVVQVILCYFSK